ncbi:TetR/AcrR family transcriptional regulator [Nocardioides panacisoli]|uniref:TetR/AcrR family transcriptional regulator n=1 Tax=Nocardioides panacisoli TaxID=627624 RepID=A0ABP7I7I3_9ACTN
MSRPRIHSFDALLDEAERLVTTGDPAGLTLRSLATRAGASNGTIYHAFHSKEELLARLWLRAVARLGDAMAESRRSADLIAGGAPTGADEVVAVAIAPVLFTRRHPASAQLFFVQRSDQLFSAGLSPEVVALLDEEERRFVRLLKELAAGVWKRTDRAAVEAIAACVVDLPGGILRRALIEKRDPDPLMERRIAAAARAILALPLDPPDRTHP